MVIRKRSPSKEDHENRHLVSLLGFPGQGFVGVAGDRAWLCLSLPSVRKHEDDGVCTGS